MTWITRTYRGLSVTRRPDADIPPQVLETFKHACAVFGFLVDLNERITPLDWVERIEHRYAPHQKRASVVAAIKCVLLDAPGAGTDAHTAAAFEVGAMQRTQLENTAADLEIEFTKHTSSADLRAEILDAMAANH